MLVVMKMLVSSDTPWATTWTARAEDGWPVMMQQTKGLGACRKNPGRTPAKTELDLARLSEPRATAS
jgi:hypothetical protein